jgi:NADPH2:quinone reductase
MKAIRVARTGGPEVLEYVDVADPAPGPGQALVRLEAIGVNFIDVYHRTGLYPMPLPFTPGSEGAGVVVALGEGSAEGTGARVGDRVAYCMAPGAYAELGVVPQERLVVLPEHVDTATAAATMLQGMTAHYLASSTYPLRPGDDALVQAAAGGVGALLVQIAKMRGARVFGTASTHHLDIARQAGADVVIDYTKEDFHDVVMQATAGRGVHVVYDSVGRTTFDKSLDSLARRGMLALFGQSSGVVPPLELARLAKGSRFVTRPTLFDYSTSRDEIAWRAGELFGWIAEGRLRIRIDRKVPLRDAAEAHRALEARETAGKVLLIP